MKKFPQLEEARRTRKSIIESLKRSVPASGAFRSHLKIKQDLTLAPLSKRNPSPNEIPPSHSSSTLNSKEKLNSCRFSYLSRFDNDIFEKFKSTKNLGRICRSSKLTETERKAQELRFEANQDMRKYTPENRKDKISKLAMSNEIKKSLTRIAKTEIEVTKKLERSINLDLKFRALEIRQQRNVKSI